MFNHSPLKNIPALFFTLTLGAYFFFGLSHLSQFITADEHYWIYERIPQYWNAWQTHKLKKTFINDKPGVSLALVSGPALLFTPDTTSHCTEQKDKTYDCNSGESERILFAFRLPLLLFNSFILTYLFWLIGKLTNPWISLYSTTLIGLSPTLLGITQILNPDTLLWSTGTASLLSFYALLKFNEWKYVFLTACFTALALLSKYAALIFLPFFSFLVLAHFLVRKEKFDPKILLQHLRKDLFLTCVMIAGTFFLLFIALPAPLLNPRYITEYLLSIPNKTSLAIAFSTVAIIFIVDIFILRARILYFLRNQVLRHFVLLRLMHLALLGLFLFILASRWLFPDWNIFSLPFDLKHLTDARYYGIPLSLSKAFILEWSPLVFSLTPLLLSGIFILWISGIRNERTAYYYFPLSLPFFIVFYIVVLLHSNILITIRYSVLFFPLFAFLAAIGYWLLIRRIEMTSLGMQFPLAAKTLLFLFLFIGSIFSLQSVKPYYFNYTNDLLPHHMLLTDAWGYGGYEAARFLNEKSGAENLLVWSDYYGFCEFFVGRCITAYSFDKETLKPDYYVLTRRGRIRYMSRYDRWEEKSGLTAYKYYDRTDPAWSLIIDNRPGNYVKVYKVDK